jgi:hypothetical protein
VNQNRRIPARSLTSETVQCQPFSPRTSYVSLVSGRSGGRRDSGRQWWRSQRAC